MNCDQLEEGLGDVITGAIGGIPAYIGKKAIEAFSDDDDNEGEGSGWLDKSIQDIEDMKKQIADLTKLVKKLVDK